VSIRLRGGNAREPERAGEKSVQIEPETPSAHNVIGLDDFDAFRPGRRMADVLKDGQWRGNFAMAAQHQGKSLVAITYQLAGSDPAGGHYGVLRMRSSSMISSSSLFNRRSGQWKLSRPTTDARAVPPL
jgi:hypothetical protein